MYFLRIFLAGLICFPVISILAKDFKSGTESAVEETVEQTVEQTDGKTVRKIRSGQVRERESDEPRVGEIEEGEVGKVKRRREALRMTSVGFGPFGSTNVGEKKVLYGISYGKIWEVSPTWEIRGDLLVAANSDGAFGSIGFGPSFIPSTGDISPLIGFELGFGGARGDDKNAGGFYGQANLGLRMFRLSDTQFEILANYSGIFTKESLGVYGLQFRLMF